ncbi:hypothetical protein SAMN05216359_11245 [Roseateles sp. YR242]|uniref:hypothetical protein n=1 Tax=Roseateles sp. YR242 TaxID=1855305 RepID=UPI0008B054AE|nr:hypothetical protein [Roseateles sp. YR242]SEL61193.1 hypothetical protein SAMN05216359_11245 [Roseateles sp. YR242]
MPDHTALPAHAGSTTPQTPQTVHPDLVSEDFVRVASFASPTEAYVLRGVLLSAGLSPRVTDDNTGQGNPWVTQAVNAVGVLVPGPEVGAARDVMAAFDAGAYELPDEDTTAPAVFDTQPALLFNPDRAALLSLLLTPIFGVAVQMANARKLAAREGRISQWMWLVVLTALSLLAVLGTHELNPGWAVAFRASIFSLGGLTATWYFISGRFQSKRFIAAYGPHYRRKSLLAPALGAVLGWLVLGALLTELTP